MNDVTSTDQVSFDIYVVVCCVICTDPNPNLHIYFVILKRIPQKEY